MSQSFWESEVVEEVQPAQAGEPQQMAEEPAAGQSGQTEQAEQAAEPAAESGALALSVDDFSALEERILRTVDLVKRERQARAEAEERASAVEAQLREVVPLTESLQKEVTVLRGERDHVRQRVERLLSQLDALEL